MGFVEGVPTVTVVLDKPRALAFTMGAMRRVQEKLGTLELGSDGAGGLLAVPVYVWACMDAEGRVELSLEDVEDMIHPGNLRAISDALTGLLGASNPEATAEDATGSPTQAGPKLATG